MACCGLGSVLILPAGVPRGARPFVSKYSFAGFYCLPPRSWLLIAEMKSSGRPHRAPHVPDGRRDRDDDLLLFRELFKREEQRNVNLLDPVSVDFEAPGPGGNQLYRIPSKKGSDFLPMDSEKSDFDWLKTPPATPLFPSLEMDAINPSSMHYKEAPNFLKPSRFAVKDDPKAPASPGSISASSQSTSSSRSATPSRRSSSSSNSAFTLKEALNHKNKPTKSVSSYTKRSSPTPGISTAKSASSSSTTTITPKTQSRRMSPQNRSRIPASLPGFTDVAPPNLVTSVVPGRASSASRGRQTIPAEPKVEAARPRRQSCSPGAIRGRKPAEVGGPSEVAAVGGGGGSGNLVVGSRMVEKMMNARRSAGSAEEMKSTKAKQRSVSGSSPSEGSGFGRLMTRSSMDVAYQHMEIRKSSNDQLNMSRGKSSSPAISSTTTAEPNTKSPSIVDAKSSTVETLASPEKKSLMKNKFEKKKWCGFC